MNEPDNESKAKIASSQWRLFFVVLVLGLSGIFYGILREHRLYNSAALYIGLPLLLALGLSLSPKTKSALGATMKGMTIALLLSAIVFLEGYICILLAAPIFYAVGALIAYPIDRACKREDKNSTLQTACIATVFGLLSLEGTTEMTTVPRHNEIIVSKIVAADITDIRSQLSKTPEFTQDKPVFLKIFPYPAQITGQGLNIGDERVAKFIAYKHIWWSKVEGDLVMKITENSKDKIKFAVVKDDSYLSHYLKWQSSEVSLESVDSTHTKVTWKLSYERMLDPAWYFSPMQRYAATLAARELIDHVATPHT
ncbi:MAG: hypothetical protein ACOYK8_01740 [Alphaproteobacteria bacterium]